MAFMTRTVASALLLAVGLRQAAALMVGCGPGATVELAIGATTCTVVEFGNCTVAGTTLSLEPSAQCDAVPNSGMVITAASPAGIVQACAIPSETGVWLAWASSTQEPVNVDLSVFCVPSPLPCTTTQICNSNYGCCTTPGFGSCSVAGGHTLTFAADEFCLNYGPNGAVALSTSDGVNNATTCGVQAGGSTWVAWWGFPSIGWQDTMNATCV